MSDNLGSAFNPKKQALSSQSDELIAKRAWTGKKKLCWKCQKEKTPFGGHQTITSGFYKFICKECCDAKKAKNESSSGN